MSNTPRTDAKEWSLYKEGSPDAVVSSEFARQLERDLAAVRAEGENLHAKMRELDAALIAALKRAEEAEREAGRYRKIRRVAWQDSCIDDDVVGTLQAPESEFNEGFDQEIDGTAIDAARKP